MVDRHTQALSFGVQSGVYEAARPGYPRAAVDWVLELLGEKAFTVSEGNRPLRFADIGAGTGYFARRIAEKVAPKGHSIGFDVNPAMVDYMLRDAAARDMKDNYRAELIQSRNPVLQKDYYDLIFFCNTYQHIENRVAYFKTLAQSLKRKGRIVIIDFAKLEKADEESGEVPANLVDKNTVKREFKKAGFRLKRDLSFLPSQFFLEFTRS